jgi:hypothetical protein
MKERIRAVSKDSTRKRRPIFYGELGELVGLSARGPWKSVLDEIANEETARGCPDVTFLVINKTTGLPGQLDFESTGIPASQKRARVRREHDTIFAAYAKGRCD